MGSQERKDSSSLPEMWIATIAPTRAQRRVILIVMGAHLLAFLLAIPFAGIRLWASSGFIPAVQAIIFCADLVTALLLLTQVAISRSRALLLLANGYLFTAVIVVAHSLSFPDAFAPDGVIGGLQTAGWLHIIWHLGFPVSVIAYSLAKRPQAGSDTQRISSRTVWVGVAATISLALGLVLLLILADEQVPRLFIDKTTFSPLVPYVGLLDTLACLTAFVLLWHRRNSLLDEWILLATFATLIEMAMVTFFLVGRFDVGWYVVRIFGVTASIAVLVVLITETTRMHAALSYAILSLREEKASKLLTLEAMAGALSHELNQPLGAIQADSEAALLILKKPGPLDHATLSECLNAIIGQVGRVTAIFRSIRALIKDTIHEYQPVNVNELVAESLQVLSGKMRQNQVSSTVALASGTLIVDGQKGQLSQVLINLFDNAVDAMSEVTNPPRMLRVKTEEGQGGEVSIIIEDNGNGISPDRITDVFDAFVTTKTHGTGLGLALCKAIVERHHGTISVLSRLGSGTQFRINLPPSGGRTAAQPSGIPTNQPVTMGTPA